MTSPREAFLDFLADCDWKTEPDADTTDSGRIIDCTTFEIRGSIQALQTLCDALDIKPRYEQTIEDAISEAIDAPRSQS